ncbi:MAG: MarR family transcriptional regulator [Anaerolineaceae bacterium]|nr:MarR family transcriptional regulator [Anaerolineaceae bacterium]
MTRLTRTQIDDDLYLLLRTIYHYEKLLESKTGLDFQKMYLLLHLVNESPLRLTEVAKELNIPMFSASRLVDRMVSMGLIGKVQDENDKRSISISLEPQGQAMIDDLEHRSYDRIQKNFSDLKDEDFNLVMQVIEKMHRILEVSEKVTR